MGLPVISDHSQALPKGQSSTVQDIKEDKPKPFGLWPKQGREPLAGKQARSFSYQPRTLQVMSQPEPAALQRWKRTSSGLWLEAAPCTQASNSHQCRGGSPQPTEWQSLHIPSAALWRGDPLLGAFTTLLWFTHISRLCLRVLRAGEKRKEADAVG